jgi:hypothetical protein
MLNPKVKLMPLFFLLLWPWLSLLAQDKAARQWQDGLYYEFKHFQLNQPPHSLKPLQQAKFVLDNEENIVFLQGQQALLDSLWGFCMDAKPYLRIEADSNGQEDYFVQLKILGRISYFDYPVWQIRPVNMEIYNPMTGRKIGQRQVLNKEKVMQKRILSLETGQIQPLEYQSLSQWIQQDIGLKKSLDELGAKATEEQLLKVIRIYNDRNPLP